MVQCPNFAFITDHPKTVLARRTKSNQALEKEWPFQCLRTRATPMIMHFTGPNRSKDKPKAKHAHLGMFLRKNNDAEATHHWVYLCPFVLQHFTPTLSGLTHDCNDSTNCANFSCMAVIHQRGSRHTQNSEQGSLLKPLVVRSWRLGSSLICLPWCKFARNLTKPTAAKTARKTRHRSTNAQRSSIVLNSKKSVELQLKPTLLPSKRH